MDVSMKRLTNSDTPLDIVHSCCNINNKFSVWALSQDKVAPLDECSPKGRLGHEVSQHVLSGAVENFYLAAINCLLHPEVPNIYMFRSTMVTFSLVRHMHRRLIVLSNLCRSLLESQFGHKVSDPYDLGHSVVEGNEL